MVVLIHDLTEESAKLLEEKYPHGTHIVSDKGTIKHCVGCFGCWTKTPGTCVLEDSYSQMGALLGHTEELHIVSECVYGGFSPFVKNILDRSISYVHPDFSQREGKTHHRLRYDDPFTIYVWFYGDQITEEEQQTARKLTRANSINMGCELKNVNFVSDLNGLTEEVHIL